jgi:hypothetical protein
MFAAKFFLSFSSITTFCGAFAIITSLIAEKRITNIGNIFQITMRCFVEQEIFKNRWHEAERDYYIMKGLIPTNSTRQFRRFPPLHFPDGTKRSETTT